MPASRFATRHPRRVGLGAAGAAVVIALALPQAPVQAQSSLSVAPFAHVRAVAASSLRGTTSAPATRRSIAVRTQDPASTAAQKRAANQLAGGIRQGSGTVTQSAVFNSLDKIGLTASQNATRNQVDPPDSTGAIGPNHYVEFVNDKVGVYSKSTLAQLATADLDTFDGMTNAFVSDVQIQYDPVSQRWFYLNNAVDGSNNDWLAFGFSKSNDPSNLTSGWCPYAVNTDSANGGTAGSFFADFPKLGHDNLHVVFGDNTFTPTAFATAQIWSYPKPAAGSLTSCPSAPTLTLFGSEASPIGTSLGNAEFSPIPANTTDSSTRDFIVAADPPNHVMSYQLAGTATSPTLTANGDIPVNAYSLPANVPQPGSPFALDTGDARLTQAVAHVDPTHGEAVWTQHTIAGPGGYYSAVRWYELLPGNCSGGTCGSTTVRQQGNITVSSQFVFNGAISPDLNGNDAVINYNVGSSTLLAQIRSRSRISTTGLGAMVNEVTLGSSNAADQDFTCQTASKVCRWGDYAGASPDPSVHNHVWGSNQVNGLVRSGAAPQWKTQNFALTP